MSKEHIIGLYDLLWASGNWRKTLELCKKNGATAIRLFDMISWGFENPMQPFCKIRTWNTGFGQNLPFYDLTQLNGTYWQKFIEVHSYMKELGLEAHDVLHDMCSIHVNRDMYPFIACIQKVNPDTYQPNTGGGFYGLPASWQGEQEAMSYWHKRYFENIIIRLNIIGINYKLEIINEGTTMHGYEVYIPEAVANFINWHDWCKRVLNNLGISDDRIICSCDERWFGAWVFQGIDFSHHGVVKPEKVLWKLPGNHILISGDGGWDGDAEPFYLNYRNCSTEQARQIAKKILEYDYLGYEYTAHESCGGYHRFANFGEDGERVNYEAIHAIGEVFGTIPIEPQPPKPPLPPEPPAPCPPKRPCSYYFQRLNFKRWWKCIWK